MKSVEPAREETSRKAVPTKLQTHIPTSREQTVRSQAKQDSTSRLPRSTQLSEQTCDAVLSITSLRPASLKQPKSASSTPYIVRLPACDSVPKNIDVKYRLARIDATFRYEIPKLNDAQTMPSADTFGLLDPERGDDRMPR